MSDVADQEKLALQAIRAFLATKTCYDVLPVSFKLVMLDSTLSLKGALLTLLQNGVVSAPIWDSVQCQFTGLLTANDFVNALRFYENQPKLLDELNTLKLEDLSRVEEEIGATKIENYNVSPHLSLNEAYKYLIKARTHRVALVDEDPTSKRKIVVSVLTQYRLLRFVALNCKETQMMKTAIGDLGLGTYSNIVTTTMDTSLTEVVRQLSNIGVSALPVVDDQYRLLNMYEQFDVLGLVKANGHGDLRMTVGEALMRRPEDFPGVHTCRLTDTLSDIMEIVRRTRLLRLFVVDEEGKLKGIITLSDILRYICTV
ncbi:AMP-activated serine/threonine-protein kinase regulatory subunit [Starmerella bacillaris]|uniref:AMP-activated serine/threonine-protein kinase regulatory subunit n=1 Tax=Starmerella bacillaris TaxID=1247836 RepID=A0AAV5RL31_STABA|nr:AMP-activated serine/threonine-protein kinase regulatory subunit [Starmerella bacillaris]